MGHAHGENLLVRHALVPDPRTGTVIIDGRVVGATPADVRVAGGTIAAVAPTLDRHTGEPTLDAGGGAVICGLHDHHLHLRSLGAAARSVSVGPADVDGAGGMARTLRAATADVHGWVRGVGYHESVAGELDRHVLDRMVPSALLRVQHRSGVMWVLSSPALDELDVAGTHEPGIERDAAGRPTGRLFRMDAWLAERLPSDPSAADVTVVSAKLAALGVTGVTDATPGATAESLAGLVAAVDEGRLVQRAHLMCPADVALAPHPLVTRGPEKFLLDDDRLPTIDDFAGSLTRAHVAGSPVAVHCVTALQLAFTNAALELAGPITGDRIEHAAVVPPGMLERMRATGITVVVNPSLLYERGDTYLTDVDQRDLPDLLRNASLREAGIPVAGGTDAPFGDPDPWLAIMAAHRRRTRDGSPLGPDEALDQTEALAQFSGHSAEPTRLRRIAVGEPGDLCILEADFLPPPVAEGRVAATVVAGRVVHRID